MGKPPFQWILHHKNILYYSIAQRRGNVKNKTVSIVSEAYQFGGKFPQSSAACRESREYSSSGVWTMALAPAFSISDTLP